MFLSQTLTKEQFNTQIKAIRPALLREARKECQPADAENCVQEALITATALLCRFEVRGEWNAARTHFLPADDWRTDLAHWLLPFLRHVLKAFFRQQTRRGEVVFAPDYFQHPFDDDLALEHAEALAMHDAFHERLDAVPLTALQRESLTRWMLGQTLREIAYEMGIVHSTVWYHIEAAKKRLEVLWDDYDISPQMLRFFYWASKHAKYTKPQGTWPAWEEQHPPEIDFEAWKQRQARKKAVATHKAALKVGSPKREAA